MQVNGNAEFDVTGMLNLYPVVCVKANHAFNAHLAGYQLYICVGITLFVNLQGCGRPQIADEQMVDAHVFCCVVNKDEEKTELGCHRIKKDDI